MSAPPGFPAGPSQQHAPNGDLSAGMDGNFFGQLSQAEIEKKARKWRTSQRKRFNEKRRTGGGAGIDMGKAVSLVLRRDKYLLDVAGEEDSRSNGSESELRRST
jgi:hypothetical protein